MDQFATRQRLAREAKAQRQAEIERLRQLNEIEDQRMEEEAALHQAYLDAQQDSMERIISALSGPFETENIVENHCRHIPRDVCITSKTQVGKTGAIITACNNITDALISISSDNKKDQFEQMKSRLEGESIKVIDLNKPLKKTFFKDAIDSYNQDKKLVFMFLNNASKVKKWRSIFFELTRYIKDAKSISMYDEADTVTKTDTTIQEDLNIIKNNFAVHREWVEYNAEVAKNSNINGACRVWITATPENCNILYKIKCKDTIVIPTPYYYTPINKHVPVENMTDIAQKFKEVIDDHRQHPERNECILFCIDRKNDEQHNIAKTYARNENCICVLYNGKGIKIFDGEHEDTIHTFETISQVLDHVSLTRNGKPVVVVGFALMNRGISFVGADRVNPMAATTMFYQGGKQAYAINIAQILGRITGTARPDLDTRTVYCREAVMLDYQKYLENQDTTYTAINLHENINKTVAEVMKQVGLAKLSRAVDRKELRSVIDFYNSCAKRAAVLIGGAEGYDEDTAVRLIDLWRNLENNTPAARVFRQIRDNGFANDTDIRGYFPRNQTFNALTQENHGNKWGLIFKKSGSTIIFTDKAKEIVQSIRV
jgi:hypothetical protein